MKRVVTLSLCVLLSACGDHGGSAQRHGQDGLLSLVEGLAYTEAYSGDYQAPTINDIATFQESLDLLSEGAHDAAASRADDIGYELVSVSAGGAPFVCLKEQTGEVRGRGLFCMRRDGHGRAVHVSAPHPQYDIDTDTGAVRVVRGVDARFLSVSTAHRCSSGEASSCDGTTMACGYAGSYRISDMAHNTETFFQTFSNWVNDTVPGSYHVQLHGCSDLQCPTEGDAEDPAIVARLSAASTEILPESATVNRLNQALRYRVQAVNSAATTRSCSAAGDADDQRLCSTVNTQGRYINGSTDACTTPAPSAEGSRFLHIEQNLDLRRDVGGGDGITPQLLIDALNEVLGG